MVPNILQVKLVFWRNESNDAFNPHETCNTLNGAVSKLWDHIPACRWRNGVSEIFPDAEGGTKICVRYTLALKSFPTGSH
jgi:hypothetical protein